MRIKEKISKGSLRYIIIAVFLIAVNLVLATVLMHQSGSSIKELLDTRMLDITNTAAAMIDGDVLRRVTPEDKGTPEYNAIMNVLTCYQDNIDLEYIYCIRDLGNKEFVFGLDPTAINPGEFGSPIIYTDALYKASLGTPAADEVPYEDEWGTFYSAYTPVFASDGTVAGIIAVDFSKAWYDKQMAAQRRTVIIINLISLTLSGLLVMFLRRADKKRKISEEQLSATSDIYISMYEVNLLNDTFNKIKSNSENLSVDSSGIGINAMESIRSLYEDLPDPSSREKMLEFVDFSTLNERLKDAGTVTCEFLGEENKWCRARFVVAERTRGKVVSRVMYLVEDIDAEKRERDMTLEAVKLMNDQVSSVANIYFSMHEIDLINNTMCKIKTNVSDISEFFTTPMEDAQQIVNKMIDRFTKGISNESMLEFADFSTLKERLKDIGTITEEFLSNENVWCRARLVVSKRDNNGEPTHVMWLVESIDDEKKRRDELTETAQKLNYRITSIANIYKTAYELELASDTFTLIKTEGKYLTDLDTERHDHAGEFLKKELESQAEDSFKSEIIRFANLKTLEGRLFSVDTVSAEYMDDDGKWLRGRFVVSRRDDRGRATHVLWLTEDIDNEKQERDKLLDMSTRALAESEAKSSFLSNVSHAICSPINDVLEMNDTILGKAKDNEILRCAGNIKTSGLMLLGMVNDILEFSKIETGEIVIAAAEYDLSALLKDLVTNARERTSQKGLTLELDINRNTPRYLSGDKEHFEQIVTTLLENAVKFTQKGRVTLSVDFEKLPDDPAAVILDVAVIDTGMGIKKEELHKLFEEFDTAKEYNGVAITGVGLGMSVVRHLLKMMDSSLNIESIYGVGTKLSFLLRQSVSDWESLGEIDN